MKFLKKFLGLQLIKKDSNRGSTVMVLKSYKAFLMLLEKFLNDETKMIPQ